VRGRALIQRCGQPFQLRRVQPAHRPARPLRRQRVVVCQRPRLLPRPAFQGPALPSLVFQDRAVPRPALPGPAFQSPALPNPAGQSSFFRGSGNKRPPSLPRREPSGGSRLNSYACACQSPVGPLAKGRSSSPSPSAR
jgi:hypothetical protein